MLRIFVGGGLLILLVGEEFGQPARLALLL